MTCADCKLWTEDTDPETGESLHRCGCAASDRLDDITEGDDGCDYGQTDA